MPDTRHGPTLLAGFMHRLGRDTPAPDRQVLRQAQLFARNFVKQFEPIRANADTSQERWLRHCNSYPEWRKNELRSTWREHNGQITEEDLIIKMFAKSETYSEFKHARAINSRSDMAKCYFGPYFKLMEEEVYKHPAFIKHVPVAERPAYIMDMLGKFPGPFMETDYTSFEASFVDAILDTFEFELYRHMMQNFPVVLEWMSKAMRSPDGVLNNRCYSRTFRVDIAARRMSGEMCTSLGNGITNLMLASFVSWRKGGKLVGVVEGDDGLFFSDVELNPRDFEELGFTIKMLFHDSLLRTSFCGLVMSRDLATMTDPREVLLNFGWSHSPQAFSSERVRRELLRAKALSLAYEHPQCPIISALARAVLRETEGTRARFDSGWYDYEMHRQAIRHQNETMIKLEQGPSSTTRSDFASHYGVPVVVQQRIEDELNAWTGGCLSGPWVRYLFAGTHKDARRYHDAYTSAWRDHFVA